MGCGTVWGRDVGVEIRRGGQVRMVTCGGCGREMRAGNLAMYQRGGVPSVGPGRGGGLTPDGVDSPHGWMDGKEKEKREEMDCEEGKDKGIKM